MKADHSIAYFMDELDRISDEDYIPTDRDILLQVELIIITFFRNVNQKRFCQKLVHVIGLFFGLKRL